MMRVFSFLALLLRSLGYRHDTPRAFAPSQKGKSIASGIWRYRCRGKGYNGRITHLGFQQRTCRRRRGSGVSRRLE
jgi:hypothetical protein